jgi:hypothetical protein
MSSSGCGGNTGNKLFSQVTELTGLPEDLISEELKSLLERKGVAPEQVTMESLREALADYLSQVIFEVQKAEDDLELLQTAEPATKMPQ